MSSYADLVTKFLSFKRLNNNRSDRTVDIYALALQRLAEFFDGRDPLEATDDDLLAFTGPWLHKQGVVAVSRRPYVAAVRGFYKWCLDSKHSQYNASAALPYPRLGRKLPKMITLQHAEALMWAPDFNTFEGVRDGAMLAVLIGCGLRVSGLVRLNVSHVVEQLHESKPRLFIRVIEKADRERMVPLPPETDLQLRVYMEHPDLKDIDRALKNGDQVLFVSTRNRTCAAHEYRGERRRLNRRSVVDMIHKYGTEKGIPQELLHPHAMRHLYGTELAEASVDKSLRQKLMGHEDPKSGEIYEHTAMRLMVREVDRGNPLSKIRTPVTDVLKRLRT